MYCAVYRKKSGKLSPLSLEKESLDELIKELFPDKLVFRYKESRKRERNDYYEAMLKRYPDLMKGEESYFGVSAIVREVDIPVPGMKEFHEKIINIIKQNGLPIIIEGELLEEYYSLIKKVIEEHKDWEDRSWWERGDAILIYNCNYDEDDEEDNCNYDEDDEDVCEEREDKSIILERILVPYGFGLPIEITTVYKMTKQIPDIKKIVITSGYPTRCYGSKGYWIRIIYSIKGNDFLKKMGLNEEITKEFIVCDKERFEHLLEMYSDKIEIKEENNND